MLHTDKLKKILTDHHARCAQNPGSAFTIQEVVGLGVGIIGFRDTDGERGIVFDRSIVRSKVGSPLDDDSFSLKGFPSHDAGFMVIVTPKLPTWKEFRSMIDRCIVRRDGARVEWLEQEVALG